MGGFMKSILFCAATCFALLLPGCTAPATQSETALQYLGVLEDVADPQTNTYNYAARALFVSEGGKWQSIASNCHYEDSSSDPTKCLPKNIGWISYDFGDPPKILTGTTPESWKSSAEIGRQTVTINDTPTNTGDRNLDFSGWTEKPVYKPLILTLSERADSKSDWSAAELDLPTLTAVRENFMSLFPTIDKCDEPSGEQAISDGDLLITGQVTSASGWALAVVSATGSLCDGPVFESPFSRYMFAVSPSGESVLLGEGLRVVGGGDFNADGRAELLVAISRYNQDGYALYSDDFSDSTTVTWKYH